MNGKRKHGASAPDVAVSAEEKEMEEFLFGKNILTSKSSWEDAESSAQLSLDVAGSAADEEVAQRSAAWHDEDDDELEVDLNETARLKRLKFSKKASGSNKVSGTELTRLLQERFHPQVLDWAVTPLDQAPRNALLDDEDYMLMQQADGMLGRKQNRGTIPLPASKIRMQRVLDGNHSELSPAPITTTCFHSNSESLLVASEEKGLRWFKVDHETNPLLVNLKFKDLMVRSAAFVQRGDEIVVTGRKPYFYTYHSSSGHLTKLPGPAGEQNLQHLSVSPEGLRMCVVGSNGFVHVADCASKSWVDRVKMNGQASAACFLTDNLLVSSNNEATVYLWDLRFGRQAVAAMQSAGAQCVGKFDHDDGTATTSLSAYHPGRAGQAFGLDSSYISVGTASGVVSIFQGVDQPSPRGYYPFHAKTENSADVGVGFAQVKTVMNLTTKISATAFHPSGQILAIASYEKKDQLKLVHLPSYTVFSNWPQSQTPLHSVETLEFSPDGQSLAVGNRRGKVLIFQMPHFMSQKSRKDLKSRGRMN